MARPPNHTGAGPIGVWGAACGGLPAAGMGMEMLEQRVMLSFPPVPIDPVKGGAVLGR